MHDAALDLIRFGFSVFPLQPKSKDPYSGVSWKDLISNGGDARQWLADVHAKLGHRGVHFSVDSNFAVLMGRSAGIIGLDIDYDDGADPELLKRLPPSWTVKTGKGHHVFYKYPEHWPEIGLATLMRGQRKDKNGKYKACVSLRGNGHYFVGAGSIHPETGARYEWAKYEGWHDEVSADLLSPDEVQLAVAPDFLLDAIDADKAREKEPGEKYYENERHAMFVATATAMRKEGYIEEEIYGRLMERNRVDCVPPKENPEKELRNIAKWVCLTVVAGSANGAASPNRTNQTARTEATPSQAASPVPHSTAAESQELEPPRLEGIRPLGHLDNDYFYLTDSNQQISRISTGSHGATAMLNLMPYEYWAERYFSKRGVDWTKAASDMMLACRRKGIFNAKRVRGEGPWVVGGGEIPGGGRYVLHLGSKLWSMGRSCGLLDATGRDTYRLGPDLPEPASRAATQEECQRLIAACEAASWVRPESAILLAGSLALLRLSGALPWRPHVWLTGPAGSGKTTLLGSVVGKMVGQWGCYVQGDTSGAGIRQKLGARSLPVIFDESETQDKRGAARMQGVLELARQASSDSEGRVVKGTPSGSALEFKVGSSFFLASIRVGLVQEADLTRFAVLELGRPDESKSGAFFRAVDGVDAELGELIFRRMLDGYEDLMANYELLRGIIARGSSPRQGQQYGMLLAGYSILKHWVDGSRLREGEAGALIQAAGILNHQEESDCIIGDEIECIDHLVSSHVRLSYTHGESAQDYSIRFLAEQAYHGNQAVINAMELHGLGIKDKFLVVASKHPSLDKVFGSTKWSSGWWRSLVRLGGAKKDRHRFNRSNPKAAIFVPMTHVVDESSPVTPSDTINAPF